MKRICLVLSALALCCTMLIGAGAVGTSSQMSLTQQAITHFQQSPPEKDTSYPEHTAWKSWQMDSCEVLPCRLIEEKDIWKLIFTPSDYSSRWVCAVDLSAGTIVTPLFDGLDGQIWKCADDQLLLEHSDTYQLCDLNGSLTDISIPHAGHVLAVDDQGYVLCQYPVTRTVRTDSGTMPYTFHQYTLLGPDFTVLQDGIDQYYNVGQYDYSCDSELFYNGLVAVRVGATDWYLPDGGPWPRLYFNSKYMFIDRSGKANILNSTSKCGQYLVPFFHGEQEEVVYLLCLDAKCKALCCVPVHRGSITVASISVRKIVQTALNQNAASVVLAHNHPSGYALPSQEDLDTTRTLQTALQSVGIVLADHIIVADDDYVSLADDGYLGGSYGL